jgi:hypothetical protein
MAFTDIQKILYDGKVKINYLDKPHMYFRRMRENWDLPETDPKAWGKAKRPKGTTTLLGDTLEKKGLMTWPMGLALRELTGFYDFTNDKGDRMTGFSKGVGTLWDTDQIALKAYDQAETMERVLSASKAHLRKKKKGADIGSIVHDAIEHYVLANPNHLIEKTDEAGELVLDAKGEPELYMPPITGSGFDIGETYMWSIKEAEYEDEAEKDQALKDFQADVQQAEAAFGQFKIWWEKLRPELLGAEDLIYSLELDYSGTYDGLVNIDREDHPCAEMFPNKQEIMVLCDWKTSNASGSAAAAAPMGVYYSYFVQSAMYALAWAEMGYAMPDDLAIVSARKDGNFDVVYASQLGLTMDDCIAWARAVISCYRLMDKSKKGLVQLGKDKEAAI